MHGDPQQQTELPEMQVDYQVPVDPMDLLNCDSCQ